MAALTRSLFHRDGSASMNSASSVGRSTRMQPWLKSRRSLPNSSRAEVECR
nr:hypothetical protein [Massilia mucilaginosa]